MSMKKIEIVRDEKISLDRHYRQIRERDRYIEALVWVCAALAGTTVGLAVLLWRALS